MFYVVILLQNNKKKTLRNSKNEGKYIFMENKNWKKKIITSESVLQQIVKNVPQAKGNWFQIGMSIYRKEGKAWEMISE